MSGPPGIEEACEEIIALRRAVDDLNVQCRFWRQAAEHAVKGWNALEDKYEMLLESARNAETCLANTLAYVAPPVEDQPAEECGTADLGFGPRRIVETEKPI